MGAPQAPSILFDEHEIAARVEELGHRITADYAGREPVLVSVLKGSAVFLADLIRAIRLPLSVEHMAISRFGDAAESEGRVQILKDLDAPIEGRDVIVVEDIADTGLTLTYLLGVLAMRAPRSLEVCALLDKTVRRIVPLEVAYPGFECPDAFVVGYGLDLDERWRNLRCIVAVPDVAAARARPALLARFLDGE